VEKPRRRKVDQCLKVLAKQRKVDVVQGEAKFTGPFSLEVSGTDGARRIDFKQCIIAVDPSRRGCPVSPTIRA